MPLTLTLLLRSKLEFDCVLLKASLSIKAATEQVECLHYKMLATSERRQETLVAHLTSTSARNASTYSRRVLDCNSDVRCAALGLVSCESWSLDDNVFVHTELVLRPAQCSVLVAYRASRHSPVLARAKVRAERSLALLSTSACERRWA